MFLKIPIYDLMQAITRIVWRHQLLHVPTLTSKKFNPQCIKCIFITGILLLNRTRTCRKQKYSFFRQISETLIQTLCVTKCYYILNEL